MIYTKQIKDKKNNIIGEISYSLGIKKIHIDSIWVHHKLRRQGIGKTMILDILEDNEQLFVSVDTTEDSKKIFKNMGFTFPVERDKYRGYIEEDKLIFNLNKS